MAMLPGRHAFSAEQARKILRASRDGLAAQAGHDLMIDVDRWSGGLTVAADGCPGLEVHADLGSTVAKAGTGGMKPLTADRDKREIVMTACNVLRIDRSPEAMFTAPRFVPDLSGKGEGG